MQYVVDLVNLQKYTASVRVWVTQAIIIAVLLAAYWVPEIINHFN